MLNKATKDQSPGMHLGGFFQGRCALMCEANAYLRKPGEDDELFLEMVDRVLPREDGLMLEDIFGKRKIIKAKIVELALVDHKIILERV